MNINSTIIRKIMNYHLELLFLERSCTTNNSSVHTPLGQNSIFNLQHVSDARPKSHNSTLIEPNISSSLGNLTAISTAFLIDLFLKYWYFFIFIDSAAFTSFLLFFL